MGKSISKLMQDARKNYSKGKYDKALESVKEALKLDARDTNLHIFMGDVYIKQELIFEGIKKYEDAIDIYEQEGIINNAIAICKKIIRAKESYAKVYFRLGRLYAQKGFVRDAINNYTKFADLKMEGDEPDMEAVLEAYTAIVELAPENLKIQERLAELYIYANRSDDAKEIYVSLIKSYTQKGDTEKAEEFKVKLEKLGGEVPSLSVSVDEIEPEEALGATQEISLDNINLDVEAGGEEEISFDMEAMEGEEDFSSLDMGELEGEGGLEIPPFEEEGGEEIPKIEEEESEEISMDSIDLSSMALGEEEIPEVEEVEETPEVEPEEPEDLSASDMLKDLGFGFETEETEEEEIEENIEEEEEIPVEEETAEVLESFVPEVEAEPEEEIEEEVELMEQLEEEVKAPPTPPKRKRRPRTIEEAARLLEEDPHDWDLYVTMGELFERLSIEQGDVNALTNAAMVYIKAAEGYASQEQLEEAYAAYKTWSKLTDDLDIPPEEEMANYQKMVEISYQLGRDDWTVESYLLMAKLVLSQGDINRARSIYRGILRIDKGNKIATQKLMDIDMGRYSEEPSPAPQPAQPEPQPSYYEPPEQEPATQEEEYVDLASLMGLDEEESEPVTRISLHAEAPDTADIESLESILDNFKAGLAETIEEEDYASHYDLGIAYKEMELLDDAIHEFQIATMGGEQKLKAFEAIGQCFLDKGDPEIAIRQILRGLQVRGYAEEQYIGLRYNLAVAYEQIGELEKALDQYREVYILNVNFKDVHKRMEELNRKLSGETPKQAQKKPFSELQNINPFQSQTSSASEDHGLFDLGKELAEEIEQANHLSPKPEKPEQEELQKPVKKPKKKKNRVSYI